MLAEIGYLAESQPDPASVQPDPAERQPVQQQPILTAIALVDAAPYAPVSAVAVHSNPAPVFQDASFLPVLRSSSAPPIVLELEPVLGPAVVEVEDDQTAYMISGP